MIELKPLPHAEAISYFRSKGYAQQLSRFHHLDHFREDHARDFVVAKAMRNDILELIRTEMDLALSEGGTLARFQADLEPALRKAGWWGRQQMTDPLTGETQEVQLGSLRRLRTIYDTNMRTAHAAGHWARIQRTKKAFPYLHYIQIERPSKRHDHERFHDKIWRVDDPVWLRIYPPNGFFCGCHVVQRTEGWMQRNGRQVSEPPDLDEVSWTNKRTGETFRIPRGVHPGFDTNPGATWLDLEQGVDAVASDLTEERRARDRGRLQALRLRQTAIGRDTLLVTDASGGAPLLEDAPADRPEDLDVASALDRAGDRGPDTGLDLLRSRATEAPFTSDDLEVLTDPRVTSYSAVSPGGALWRIRPGPESFIGKIDAFTDRAARLVAEEAVDLTREERQQIVNHALGLYLERRGVIRYDFRVTGRLRDLFARFGDLIGRLSA
ncbi:MAG: hypothetical protein CML68_20345 [Rhodobacteraceae bacterium]|nr:hypothetical protein [Paracoccaceae bacterium]